MDISFDPAKRDRTLAERGLDFADAGLVFAGVTATIQDMRRDYREDQSHHHRSSSGPVLRLWSGRHASAPDASFR